MKIKKLFFVLVSVCLLTFSQSAFASEASTKVIGVGDTLSTAIPISLCTGSCSSIALPLQSNTDVDWFTWSNNTGSDKYTSINLSSPATANYTVAYQIRYTNGALSTKVYAADAGVGGFTTLNYILVPPGATLYFEISARSSVDPTSNYNVLLTGF
ncbi:hypothetical protein [Paenibacillus daejeonensis]|uniref:hypothetical protein n=1 Tax=Paenibacillus daejeonensis TaxID=135193 RepID=UPI0012F800B2|nr:hypothetical protein [Paenibacillus daejeonensis]